MWEANSNVHVHVLERRDESRDRDAQTRSDRQQIVHTRWTINRLTFFICRALGPKDPPGIQSGPCKSPAPPHSPTNHGHPRLMAPPRLPARARQRFEHLRSNYAGLLQLLRDPLPRPALLQGL